MFDLFSPRGNISLCILATFVLFFSPSSVNGGRDLVPLNLPDVRKTWSAATYRYRCRRCREKTRIALRSGKSFAQARCPRRIRSPTRADARVTSPRRCPPNVPLVRISHRRELRSPEKKKLFIYNFFTQKTLIVQC